MNMLSEMLKIAEIHEQRLCYAREDLSKFFPITKEKVTQLSREELYLIEFYTSRFSKLQDLMGQKIFTQFLKDLEEPTDEMSFIDKLNKLEKLNIINSVEEWKVMRQVRNHLAHEYPDKPELTADNLNKAYQAGEKLLDCLEKIRTFSETHAS